MQFYLFLNQNLELFQEPDALGILHFTNMYLFLLCVQDFWVFVCVIVCVCECSFQH